MFYLLKLNGKFIFRLKIFKKCYKAAKKLKFKALKRAAIKDELWCEQMKNELKCRWIDDFCNNVVVKNKINDNEKKILCIKKYGAKWPHLLNNHFSHHHHQHFHRQQQQHFWGNTLVNAHFKVKCFSQQYSSLQRVQMMCQCESEKSR